MTSPVLALRRAILDAASADAELRALMGGALRLYDEPPRAAEPVYALFGDVSASDWSTDLDRGHEQSLSLVVWSEKRRGAHGARRRGALRRVSRRCSAHSREPSPRQPARHRALLRPRQGHAAHPRHLEPAGSDGDGVKRVSSTVIPGRLEETSPESITANVAD